MNSSNQAATQKECIEALQEAAEILGKSPTIHEYRELDILPSHTTVSKHFGGWNKAKKAANLQTTPSPQEVYNRGVPDILTYSEKEWKEIGKHLRHRRRNQAKAAKIKLERGCQNCEYNENPAALEFHHTSDDKDMNVGHMISTGLGWERIESEIEKCIVLCSNCHRIEENKEVYDV